LGRGRRPPSDPDRPSRGGIGFLALTDSDDHRHRRGHPPGAEDLEAHVALPPGGTRLPERDPSLAYPGEASAPRFVTPTFATQWFFAGVQPAHHVLGLQAGAPVGLSWPARPPGTPLCHPLRHHRRHFWGENRPGRIRARANPCFEVSQKLPGVVFRPIRSVHLESWPRTVPISCLFCPQRALVSAGKYRYAASACQAHKQARFL
jgi:hypothetical protein